MKLTLCISDELKPSYAQIIIPNTGWVFLPSFGYDLCDYICLESNENGVSKYHSNNFYLPNIMDHYFIEQKPKGGIVHYIKDVIAHPYFHLNVYNRNNNLGDYSNQNDIVIAHKLINHYLSIVEGNSEIGLESFKNYIANTIMLPRFSIGSIETNIISLNNILIDENTYTEYYKKMYEMQKDTSLYSTFYYCDNFIDLIFAYTYHIFQQGYTLKRCSNCNKWFIPINRSDTLYCDRFAPQDNDKSCKKYATEQTYKNKLENDELRLLYRRNYQRLATNAKRYSDIDTHVNQFNEYKRLSKIYKSKVKDGTMSNQDYFEWLKKFDNRRTPKEDK